MGSMCIGLSPNYCLDVYSMTEFGARRRNQAWEHDEPAYLGDLPFMTRIPAPDKPVALTRI